MPTRGRKLTLLFATLAVVVLGLAGWVGWPYARFWYLFRSLGLNAQGYAEYEHRQTGIVMVRLPGGTFWMGAQKEDPKGRNHDPQAQKNEGPVHKVTLSPFLIGKLEVTQGQWEAVLGENPSVIAEGMRMRLLESKDLPVKGVSGDHIQEFEARTGLVLPTEAQWEYACRAGNAGARCFENDAGSRGEYCWYWINSGMSTHPVGRKLPNNFGLHDMHGNVGEQCKDTYDAEFYSRSEAQAVDPICRQPSDFTVWRGGSWGDRATRCRPAFRGRLEPSARNIVGFRPAAPCP